MPKGTSKTFIRQGLSLRNLEDIYSARAFPEVTRLAELLLTQYVAKKPSHLIWLLAAPAIRK